MSKNVADWEEHQTLHLDQSDEECWESCCVEVFVGLYLVLVERSPPADVHSQVEESVYPVD